MLMLQVRFVLMKLHVIILTMLLEKLKLIMHFVYMKLMNAEIVEATVQLLVMIVMETVLQERH